MRFIRRADRQVSDAELDQHLTAIFDDDLTPGAPRALYSFVSAIPQSPPASGSTRLPLIWRTAGRRAQLAASLAVTTVLAAGLLFVAANRGSHNVPAGNLAPCSTGPAASPSPATAEPTSSPVPQGTFSPTGSMAIARDQATATLLCDGRVLIAGGMGAPRTSGSAALAAAELYDPTTGIFSPTGSLATARMDHTATLLPDGHVLITGGLGATRADGTATLASAELYDPASGLFSPTGSMASARFDAAATLLDDGRVLVAGGFLDSVGDGSMAGLVSAELYDPATGRFSPTGSLTTARAANTATLLLDGRVLIAGGISGDLYDPQTGSFSSAGPAVSRRYLHTATRLLDGRVLLAGGYGDGPTLTATELYDPNAGKFIATGSMAVDRTHSAAALLPGGRVLIAGGDSATAGTIATAELYDPATGAFSSAGSMTVARTWETATTLRDGRVLIAGGDGLADGGSPPRLASAELYQP
jgi:large repetitive protein